MNGASQAKSLSGRPKTDPLTDHLGVFSQLAGRVLMGLPGVLRAAQGGPRRFCVLVRPPGAWRPGTHPPGHHVRLG